MNKRIMLLVICILSLTTPAIYSQDIWMNKDGNIRNIDGRGILIDKGEFYLATKNEVYKAKDTTGKWESIFFLPSGANEINCIGGASKNIFIGTKRGLFRSQDYGKGWKNVFKTIIPEKNNILAIEISRHNSRKVVIGTRAGIFMSDDSGTKWQDITDNLKNRIVKCIALNKDYIYAGCDGGLYVRKDEGIGWERLFVKSITEKANTEEPQDTLEAEEGEGDIAINCIAIKDKRIYIGSSKEILYSDDKGKDWLTFSQEGLAGIINYILPSSDSDKIYCATTKGVFEFAADKSKWLELYKGMDKVLSVNKIMLDSENQSSMWALTDSGVYRLEGGKYLANQYIDIEKSLRNLKVVFDSEPTLQELQRVAIKYAEVSPEKIRKWRQEARMRALLPKVSFGVDTSKSTTSEIYTSATRDYVIVGPDDVSNDLDLSVSWELGDLIWSDDQTNIDVRSRLMVQLRNDILDDLRRAYYERKRIQFELMTEPPKDLKARFEKEMRLQELTSAIDDLTGNYLSAKIKKADDFY